MRSPPGTATSSCIPEGPQEVAEVAEALNALSSGLSQSEAREREFLLSVSHDLRTPLTTISGYAESLADGMIAPDRTQEVGAVLLAESQRLSRLVADLLDLARLGAQEFRIDLIDLDVLAFARTTAEVWAARCAAVGVRFQLECPVGSACGADRSVPAAAGAGRVVRQCAANDAGRRADRAGRASDAGSATLGGRGSPRWWAGIVRCRPRGRLRAVGALRPLPGRPAGRHRPGSGDRAWARHPPRRRASRPATRPRAVPGSRSDYPAFANLVVTPGGISDRCAG